MAKFRTIARLGLGVSLLAGSALLYAQDDSAGARYAKLLADTESLARHNEQLTRQLSSQQSQAADLERQIAEMDATGAQMPALIKKMFDSLQAFVAEDLPFIDPTQAGPDSRKERMDRLSLLMAEISAPPVADAVPAEGGDGDVEAGEASADVAADATTEEEQARQAELLAKQHARNVELYRRLLEAYQIELDYGRNMVAYKGKLPDERDADFVRVGRVSLLYRTADGEEAGYWDAQQKQWVVANEYNKAIEKAVLIATKELAPDLVEVPVPAPQEVPL